MIFHGQAAADKPKGNIYDVKGRLEWCKALALDSETVEKYSLEWWIMLHQEACGLMDESGWVDARKTQPTKVSNWFYSRSFKRISTHAVRFKRLVLKTWKLTLPGQFALWMIQFSDNSVNLKHACKQGGGLSSYGVPMHGSVDVGMQQIQDTDFTLTTFLRWMDLDNHKQSACRWRWWKHLYLASKITVNKRPGMF